MPLTLTLQDTALVDSALESSIQTGRSSREQIEHWAKLGHLIERTGLIDMNKVNVAFQGSTSVNELTPLEAQLHLAMLHEHLESLDGKDTRILDEIRQAGLKAVSQDRHGNTVWD